MIFSRAEIGRLAVQLADSKTLHLEPASHWPERSAARSEGRTESFRTGGRLDFVMIISTALTYWQCQVEMRSEGLGF